MANAKPSRKVRSLDAPVLEPNPIVSTSKPEKRDDGSEYVVSKLANGDAIETRVDVDPKFLRTRRGS